MFSRHLAQQGHTRQFEIHLAQDGGWDVREEADRRVVRHVRYTDWHRVERARTAFSMRVQSLQQEGWTDVKAGESSQSQAGSQAGAATQARAHGHSTNR